MLVFGPISDFVKIEWLLIGTGILIIVLTYFFGSSKVLLEAGKPIEKIDFQEGGDKD